MSSRHTEESESGSGRPDGSTPEPARSTPDTESGHRSPPPERRAVFASETSPRLGVLVALFVGVMLISNITGTKAVVLFPDLHLQLGFLRVDGVVTDGAFYLFPLAYVLGDVISEVYGFRAMRRVVGSGFAILLLAALCFTLTVHLPAADFYDGQQSFERVAGVVPRFFLAGLAGYVVGELLNSYVLVRMKARTGERSLWARLLGSTVVGEFADTLVFCTIAASALGMTVGSTSFWNYTVVGFLWKTLVEIVVMPLSYTVIAWLKRNEPSYQAALREP